MSQVVLESGGLALTADSRVDREAGIVRGVKILGSQSRNRRTYPPNLLRERFTLYEGSQVYTDHDYTMLKTGKARPMGQWGGVLRDVSFRNDSIHGDLHCLRETPAGRVILEAAARCADKFGLSPMHEIIARKEKDGSETVTDILEVLSVDAVTRPATTRTLFEAEGDMPEQPEPTEVKAAAAPAVMSVEAAFLALQNAVMASEDYDDQEKVSVLKDVMKLKSKILGGPEEEAPAEEAPAEEAHRRPLGRQARALEELATAVRVLSIRQMAGESLPLDAPVMAVLLGLPDDAARAAYIDQLRRARRPRYTSGAPLSAARTVGEAQGHAAAGARPIPRLSAGADREAVRKYYSKG
jgi:hypothetical protein